MATEYDLLRLLLSREEKHNQWTATPIDRRINITNTPIDKRINITRLLLSLLRARPSWLAAVASHLFKNYGTQQAAAQIDLTGKLTSPGVSTWRALMQVLHNASIEAILPGFDGAVRPTQLPTPADRRTERTRLRLLRRRNKPANEYGRPTSPTSPYFAWSYESAQ